jgi:hypothetical protein
VKTVHHRDRAERRYRRAGEFPNRILLSWTGVPADALFPRRELVLKPGWDPGRWLRRARREPVEAVVGELDLRSADEIWCRNRAARAELVARGFDPERVRAVRVPVEPWP